MAAIVSPLFYRQRTQSSIILNNWFLLFLIFGGEPANFLACDSQTLQILQLCHKPMAMVNSGLIPRANARMY